MARTSSLLDCCSKERSELVRIATMASRETSSAGGGVSNSGFKTPAPNTPRWEYWAGKTEACSRKSGARRLSSSTKTSKSPRDSVIPRRRAASIPGYSHEYGGAPGRHKRSQWSASSVSLALSTSNSSHFFCGSTCVRKASSTRPRDPGRGLCVQTMTEMSAIVFGQLRTGKNRLRLKRSCRAPSGPLCYRSSARPFW